MHPISGSPALECTLSDGTAAITVVFLGRHRIAGVELGATMTVEGMVVDHHGRLAIMNPLYTLH